MEIIKYAIVSYNDIAEHHEKVIIMVNGKEVLLLPNTFLKSPGSVRADVPNWQELLKHRYSLEKVIIFIGKEDSQSLEILWLALEYFSKDSLFFLSCKHDLEKKKRIFENLGLVQGVHYAIFTDEPAVCQESPFLLEWADTLTKNM